MCIGAPKSGTTWLDKQLRGHPALWLPPIKEIHHFDCLGTTPWAFYHRFDKGIQFNLRRTASQCMSDLLTGKWNVSWYFRYFSLRRTDEWYSGLFSPSENQISGEITPAYCRLEQAQVAKIKALMPDLKVILILRNPVERYWSNLAMYFSKYDYNGIENVSDADILRMFDSDQHRRSAEYCKTIELWNTHYSEEQMMVAFFEQISTQPQLLLEDICGFLGVPKQKSVDSAILMRKENHRRYPPIPEHFKIKLHKLFQTEIEQVHQMFNNKYTADWLAENQRALP